MTHQYTLNEIEEAALSFWQQANSYRIMAFSGGLGAGKTTFTSALCKVIGVKDRVSSPTFSLINEYHFRNAEGEEEVLYHSDWYRLNDEEEAIQAGIEDILNQKNARCIIEWPERISQLLPSETLWVNFELLPDGRRQLSYRLPNDPI